MGRTDEDCFQPGPGGAARKPVEDSSIPLREGDRGLCGNFRPDSSQLQPAPVSQRQVQRGGGHDEGWKNGGLAVLEPGGRGGKVQVPDGGSSEGEAWTSEKTSDWNSGDEQMRAGDETQLIKCWPSIQKNLGYPQCHIN